MPTTAASSSGTAAAKRHMLVFDSAYTYKIMIERKVSAIVTGRDLGGYFDHIWTCHPVASLLEPEGSPERFGRPLIHQLAPRHTLVEGRIGRYPWLAWFGILNFLLAQIDLMRLLLAIIREQDIRIVRAEDAHYNGLLALGVSRFKKLPLMIGVWGNPGAVRKVTGVPIMPRLFRKVWVEELVERFVLRRADRVMAQNEDNRGFVVASGAPREKTEIFRIGNLLHEAHFTDPAARGDGHADLAALGVAGEHTLLTISRLQKLKLVDHVLHAVKTLKDRGRRVVALFVGEGPYRPEMEALAAELGIADQVLFCGNREQLWLARVIPAVSMVVSPLTGRALAEAALGGAPTVAYDIDWHSELVTTGETGELVPYLDHDAMADAIASILDDPERARRMGAALRAKAAEMLDPATADQAQIAAYQALIGDKA
jgi:glycosyltransferase involved in cell wall biosynthesis